VLEVLLNTARLIYVFMRSSSTGSGLAGEAGSMAITASKNGSAGATITPTITDLGSTLGAGWYTLALTSGHLNTLGQMALHIISSNTIPNDDVLLNVIAVDKTDAVHFGLSSLPNAAAAASGGLPTIGTGANQFTTDGAGNVNADVVVPASLATAADVTASTATIASDITASTATIASDITASTATIASDITASTATIASDITASTATIASDITTSQAAIIAAIPSASTVASAILDAARSGHITLGSVGEGIALATSLLQGNFFIDNVTPSVNGPTAQRLRCWLSASAMSGVTPGGSGQGEFATFLVTTTYSGPGAVATHKVVQQ